MSNTLETRGYARLALTSDELKVLRESRIEHSEVKTTNLKVVYVEFDDLENIVDLLEWRKTRGH